MEFKVGGVRITRIIFIWTELMKVAFLAKAFGVVDWFVFRFANVQVTGEHVAGKNVLLVWSDNDV